VSGNPIVAELLTVARKLDNYEIDPVGGLKVLWTDTTHYNAVVPAGKRWFLFGGYGARDVVATAKIYCFNLNDKLVLKLGDFAAGAAGLWYPTTAETGNIVFPYPLDAGEYVQILFSVAQTAGAYATCFVLEVDA